MKKQGLSIWFLIGLQLTIYGVLIAGAGIDDFINPPLQPTVLAGLHAGIWWGVLMFLLGAFYTVKFYPRQKIE